MVIEQVVQVRFLESDRNYTYAYRWDPAEAPGLAVGDVVEVPPNTVREDGGSGRVVALGSDYTGPMAKIVRRIEPVKIRERNEDLWAGWEQDPRYA